jgi:hypothetical protein
MMTSIATVYANIKTIIQATLGASYSELAHVYAIERNSFEQAAKRWGLVIEQAPEVDGNTRDLTQRITFSLLLTDEFKHSELDDLGLRTQAIEMFDNMAVLFKALIVQKAGGTYVSQVSDFSIVRVSVIEKTRIIECLGQFNVRVKFPF